MFEIAKEYLKLERIEITGLQGKKLVEKVNDISDEFLKTYNELGSVEYEILLPEDEQFPEDVEKFLIKVRDGLYDNFIQEFFK